MSLEGGLTLALAAIALLGSWAKCHDDDSTAPLYKRLRWPGWLTNSATDKTAKELDAARRDLKEAKQALEQQTKLAQETRTELDNARKDLRTQTEILRISARMQAASAIESQKRWAAEKISELSRVKIRRSLDQTKDLFDSIDMSLESLFIAAAGEGNNPETHRKATVELIEAINIDKLHADFLTGLKPYDPTKEQTELIEKVVADIKTDLKTVKENKLTLLSLRVTIHKVRQEIANFHGLANDATAQLQIMEAEKHKPFYEKILKTEDIDILGENK
jgi:hypothetical protein